MKFRNVSFSVGHTYTTRYRGHCAVTPPSNVAATVALVPSNTVPKSNSNVLPPMGNKLNTVVGKLETG